VPVFYGDDVHHKASLELLVTFDKVTGCCGAHSLGEVYSTPTRMRGKHRISGEQAMLFIGTIRERLSIIALTGDEYADLLPLELSGGAMYDAMVDRALSRAARKSFTVGMPAIMPKVGQRFVSV
jgi:hypothetical protein